MRELNILESSAVSGGLSLSVGRVLVGKNFKLGTVSSGSGLVGGLLGALGLNTSADHLVCLDGANLTTDGQAAPVASTCSGSGAV